MNNCSFIPLDLARTIALKRQYGVGSENDAHCQRMMHCAATHMQPLPVRTTEPPLTGITALQIDAVPQVNGLPQLTAQLVLPIGRACTVTLRIHNQAGIPIIEAHSSLAAGADTLIFSELTPLGIEAYAHAPVERRLEVAQRIWSRRAYAVLRCSPL